MDHVPSAQFKQVALELAPDALDHVAIPHLMHTEDAEAPITEEYVPAGQMLQFEGEVDATTDDQVPTLQRAQTPFNV